MEEINLKNCHVVRFTKISNKHSKLRDDKIEGSCNLDLKPGKQFIMITSPKNQAPEGYVGVRIVNTSPIKEVKNVNPTTYEILTESGSVYQIEVLSYPPSLNN